MAVTSDTLTFHVTCHDTTVFTDDLTVGVVGLGLTVSHLGLGKVSSGSVMGLGVVCHLFYWENFCFRN